MTRFTMDDLMSIVREIIGDDGIDMSENMSAKDVPGWDSLNNTLIALEIEAKVGAPFHARTLAEQPNFGALITLLNKA